MEEKQKKILAIAAVAILVVAAIIGAVALNNKTTADQKYDSYTGEEILGLDWDQIVNDANGQTVTLGFYVDDPMVKPWFTQFQKDMKSKYNITVTTNSYGPVASAIVVKEMDAGLTSKGSIDLIWGNTSAYNAMKALKYVYCSTVAGEGWVDKLPNGYYLKDNSEDMIESQISWYQSGSAAQFSNGQTMFVYNADFNIDYETIGAEKGKKIPYDVVVLVDNGTHKYAKVCTSGSGSEFSSMGLASTTIDGATTEYDIDSVRSFVKGQHSGTVKDYLYYSIPKSLTDLKNWVQIYEHQFGYPDATNSSANFHSDLFIQAVMYGIDHTTGVECTAETRAANIEWVNGQLSSITTKEDFDNKFGYVIEYLESLDPYVHVYDSEYKYQKTGNIVAYNNKIVGLNSETDYSDATIMIGMSTVTSIDSRVGEGKQYNYNAGVFSLDTGCSSDYYLHIPANSSHKTAAMVIANELLDPQIQVSWYITTGNGYNIDTTKEVKDDPQHETVYKKYFEEKVKDLKRTLSPTRLNEVTVVAQATSISAQMNACWASHFNNTKP